MRSALTLFLAVALMASHAWASDPLSMDIVDYSNSHGDIQVKRIGVTQERIRQLADSSLLKIEKVDPRFVPLDGDCYCYYPNDPDFLHLNLLYFGTGYITYMNQFVARIKGHPLKPLSVQLIMDEKNAPRGEAVGDGKIRVWFGTANFDPSVIVHEITHQIHSELLGRTQAELEQEIGTHLDRRSHAEFVGVFEGVANFMTALYLSDPVIGRIAWEDIPYSMNASISYDSMPTEYDFLNRIVQSHLFARRYAMTTQMIRGTLPRFAGTEAAKFPDPYLSSPILFAPLWKYRGHYPRDDYFQLLLSFLASNPKVDSYADFAGSLVEFLEPHDKAFAKFLRDEYASHQLILPKPAAL